MLDVIASSFSRCVTCLQVALWGERTATTIAAPERPRAKWLLALESVARQAAIKSGYTLQRKKPPVIKLVGPVIKLAGPPGTPLEVSPPPGPPSSPRSGDQHPRHAPLHLVATGLTPRILTTGARWPRTPTLPLPNPNTNPNPNPNTNPSPSPSPSPSPNPNPNQVSRWRTVA